MKRKKKHSWKKKKESKKRDSSSNAVFRTQHIEKRKRTSRTSWSTPDHEYSFEITHVRLGQEKKKSAFCTQWTTTACILALPLSHATFSTAQLTFLLSFSALRVDGRARLARWWQFSLRWLPPQYLHGFALKQFVAVCPSCPHRSHFSSSGCFWKQFRDVWPTAPQ